FNRNTNINGGNRNNIGNGNRVSNLPASGRGGIGDGGRSNWQHNPQHRRGTPYRDRATADRGGGSARGDFLAHRRSGPEQRAGRQGGSLANNRAAAGGVGNNRANTTLGNRTGGGGGLGSGGSGSGLGSGSRGGADRIGSRDVSRSGGGDRSAF